jgi:hypothetical protein
MLGALLLLAPAAAADHPASLAGLYEIRQMEVGGGLELRKNGRFRYALTYGAIDEEAEGMWALKDGKVLLTSSPMPKEPSFDLVADAPAPKCTLSISVDWGRFNWSSPPDVLVTYQDNPRELHFLQAEEQGALHPEKCAVTSILPIVPMFRIPGAPLRLSPDTGHKLSLRFQPNELGRVAFRGEALKREGSNLVMERYDAEIRFMRVRP